jgi:hypothetical protein
VRFTPDSSLLWFQSRLFLRAKHDSWIDWESAVTVRRAQLLQAEPPQYEDRAMERLWPALLFLLCLLVGIPPERPLPSMSRLQVDSRLKTTAGHRFTGLD